MGQYKLFKLKNGKWIQASKKSFSSFSSAFKYGKNQGLQPFYTGRKKR